ncbi:MAG: hypothetical protein ACRERU_13480 [Methylococcales bacterium]
MLCFAKLRHLARERGARLVFTAMTASGLQQMRRGGLDLGGVGAAVTFDHLDPDVEWCEERIIAEARLAPGRREIPLLDVLRQEFGEETAEFLRYF